MHELTCVDKISKNIPGNTLKVHLLCIQSFMFLGCLNKEIRMRIKHNKIYLFSFSLQPSFNPVSFNSIHKFLRYFVRNPIVQQTRHTNKQTHSSSIIHILAEVSQCGGLCYHFAKGTNQLIIYDQHWSWLMQGRMKKKNCAYLILQ